MKGLTKRQSEILDFIQDFIHSHNYSPSYREIMNHFALNSLGSVYKHVTVLKRKGALSGEKQGRRSVAPVQNNKVQAGIEVPLIGTLHLHQSIEMLSHSEKIFVPPHLVASPEATYALKVTGETLFEELMTDGDIILVEARSHAVSGEMVVALLETQETVIKKYYLEGSYVRLVSQNPHFQPLIVKEDELIIQGVVIGLLRQYATMEH